MKKEIVTTNEPEQLYLSIRNVLIESRKRAYSAVNVEMLYAYWKICYDNLTGHRDFYIDKQIEIIFDFYQSMKKEIQLGKLKSLLENSDGINQIVVMGHSMSSVDSEYMELIESVIVPDKWRISQYNGSPSYNDLALYSFSKKVEFFNLKNEYSNE